MGSQTWARPDKGSATGSDPGAESPHDLMGNLWWSLISSWETASYNIAELNSQQGKIINIFSLLIFIIYQMQGIMDCIKILAPIKTYHTDHSRLFNYPSSTLDYQLKG